MKKSFLSGAFLVATPLAFLIVGCSGGSGSVFTTPVPTSGTPTPTGATPTPTTIGSQTSNFTLGNGQRAIFTSVRNGGNLSGTLQILAPPTARARQSAVIPFQISFGTYNFSGTISPSGAFSISGNFGPQGAFTMTGQLQSATQNGSYTLNVGGQTDSGILPRTGQPFPTPGPTSTPNPTPTSPSGSYRLTGNLSFSNITAGSNVVSTPITSFSDFTNGGTLTNRNFNGTRFQFAAISGATQPVSGNGTSRSITVNLNSYASISDLKPFSVGQTIPLGGAQFSQTTVSGTTVQNVVWRSASGTATIKAIGTNSLSFEMKDVRFDPTSILGGTGSFTLNGTLSATGLTVINN